MNNFNPLLLGFGIFCLWPLLIGALPTFLVMRYRIRLRSPIVFSDEDDEMNQITGYARPKAEIRPSSAPAKR